MVILSMNAYTFGWPWYDDTEGLLCRGTADA